MARIANPLLRGMYPDPSVCCANGAYYLVTSSFEYYPGVPVFRSEDLVTWEQVGNALDRPSQLDLAGTGDSDGIFAPTIRYHEGMFYLVTTLAVRGRGGRATTGEDAGATDGTHPGKSSKGICLRNFLVTTTDPAGSWSDPVPIPVEGIDPSLYWEDGCAYLQFAGRGQIFQARIDCSTGEVLDGPRLLTCGCGGRDAEGPHLWKRDGWYFLMLAEGGTREGHHVTLMRGSSVWGPFEPCPYGPVLSNRDLPREPIQRVGHADWVVGPGGHDYLVALGVREVEHRSLLGRETMLAPAAWTDDGWLLAEGQRMPASWELSSSAEAYAPCSPQHSRSFALDMAAGAMPPQVISPRTDNREGYRFERGHLEVHGNGRSLFDGDCGFWGVRQPEFDVRVAARLDAIEVADESDEVGLAVRISDSHHFSLFATVRDGRHVVVLRRAVADLVCEDVFEGGAPGEPLELQLVGSAQEYRFYAFGRELGSALAKHLTVEVAGTQNTGVVDGVYVAGRGRGSFGVFEVEALT